ncbi:MAG: hypothetical protein HY903_12590 [Deltaproteobacteria bacterium]|nr:hypothetical protein [Deltaproteobacteria bacterium]
MRRLAPSRRRGSRLISSAPGAALLAAICGPACTGGRAPERQTETPRALAAAMQWLAAGGGDLPETNQLSIEQDLALAAKVFGPQGRLLFAGGPETESVQIATRLPPHSLRLELGALFDPRPGRDARYRKTTLRPVGPATVERIADLLRQATATGDGDLLVYLAGHGSLAKQPKDNGFLTWGNEVLTSIDLAQVLDAAAPARRVRLVVTSCFSGGFAETLFVGAASERGPTPLDRCGLFAATADQESSGCDPDPDRRRHDGYGVHFLHALAGEDHLGRPLAAGSADLDGDGKISLLEAHTLVAARARTFDVPTTTSERWLRARAPSEGPSAAVDLVEEEWLLTELSRRAADTSIAGAQDELAQLDLDLTAARDAVEEARAAETDAFRVVAAEMLSRWPVVNDPWHPLFDSTLAGEAARIRRYLARADSVAEHRQAAAAVDDAEAEVDLLLRQKALVERRVRAFETLQRAGRLRHVGGRDWEIFARLRACERSLPPRP